MAAIKEGKARAAGVWTIATGVIDLEDPNAPNTAGDPEMTYAVPLTYDGDARSNSAIEEARIAGPDTDFVVSVYAAHLDGFGDNSLAGYEISGVNGSYRGGEFLLNFTVRVFKQPNRAQFRMFKVGFTAMIRHERNDLST